MDGAGDDVRVGGGEGGEGGDSGLDDSGSDQESSTRQSGM